MERSEARIWRCQNVWKFRKKSQKGHMGEDPLPGTISAPVFCGSPKCACAGQDSLRPRKKQQLDGGGASRESGIWLVLGRPGLEVMSSQVRGTSVC